MTEDEEFLAMEDEIDKAFGAWIGDISGRYSPAYQGHSSNGWFQGGRFWIEDSKSDRTWSVRPNGDGFIFKEQK